ncbi:diguanylate cyclase [Planctobacterium marinum]|uniref:diguanylate cyclase n=1 Tax=Planctobacterium marinum TaxID=1631968 RepID=UPI001E500A17|nr:diguanylate cyclase [Planctobacterium marinum]MCC2606462.1 diguanylate cyclase [Planctobacterium marinum]
MLSDKPKILIVDDEKSNLKILSEFLGGDGQIMLAKSGKQALEKAARALPDIILLDVVMPDMDGFEVLKQLKAAPGTRLIPVIFITGLTDVTFEEKGLALGASDYIIKPIHEQLVRARVKLHLQLVKQQRLLEQVALIDPLTGLCNRRKYEDVSNIEWRAAVRYGGDFSVALLNLDGFKAFNEMHGYATGDELLIQVASQLAQQIRRAKDLVARFSGQEFVLLMPGTERQGAQTAAEKCLSAISGLKMPGGTGRVAGVTVSVGGVTARASMSLTLDEVMLKVRQKLNQAQQAADTAVCWEQVE